MHACRPLKFKVDYMLLNGTAPWYAERVRASMIKLRIFEYSALGAYRNVLFLDADMLVTYDIATVLSQPLVSGQLYAGPEQFDMACWGKGDHGWCAKSADMDVVFQRHNLRSFGYKNYTHTQMRHFKKHGILPFNAGTFMFSADARMKKQFGEVRLLYHCMCMVV